MYVVKRLGMVHAREAPKPSSHYTTLVRNDNMYLICLLWVRRRWCSLLHPQVLVARLFSDNVRQVRLLHLQKLVGFQWCADQSFAGHLVEIEGRVKEEALLDIREYPLLHVLPILVEEDDNLGYLEIASFAHGESVIAK